MVNMTKTEAANEIARHVNVAARHSGKTINKMLVAEIMSEYGAGHRGQFLADAANTANWRTVLTAARKQAKAQGEYHLIAN